MAATLSSTIPTLGRQIHVKKLGQDGEETDESYWLWLDFPETIKVRCYFRSRPYYLTERRRRGYGVNAWKPLSLLGIT